MHIRDPIHGAIELTADERALIDSPQYQRLRNVKQLGFADLAFPGATHTRYAHGLGAMAMATKVFDAPSVSAGTVERFDFDASPVGAPPAGMQTYRGTWAVRAEPDAPSAPNALCQTGNAEFPALALSGMVYRDVVISAKVKAISGREDQAAGLLARIQNGDNYYIGRANALENNVRLYRYTGGSRQQLSSGDGALTAGRWQELRLEVTGSALRLFLDGKLITLTTDETFTAGRMGLWTKADSTTCFDDVTITAK